MKQPFVWLGKKTPFAVDGQVNMDSLPECARCLMGADMTKVQPMDSKTSVFMNLLLKRERHVPLPR